MAGFDHERARTTLEVPDNHEIHAFIAVGRRGDASSLPGWAREKESPNNRRPLEEFVREGTFRF
jgi:hypothetical protein